MKITTIDNVKKFDFTEKDELSFIKDNKAFFFDKNFNDFKIKLPEKSTSIFFYKNELYVTDSTLLLTKIVSTNQLLKYLISIPTTIDSRTYEHYIYPIVFEKETKKRYNGKYNTQNCELENKYDLNIGINGIFKVIDSNLFFSQNNEKFGVFTFENVCVWEIYFKDLFNGYEPIGAGTANVLKTETNLYIELDKTYSLNIITGKLENIYDQKYTNSENGFLYGLQFLSIDKFNLAILNTKTNTTEIIDVSNEFNKHNIQHPDNRIVVHKNLIYFSQNMGANTAKIGIFNPVTAKIIWKFDFEKKNGMVGTLKVNKNRIYSHTQDNKLHIFEVNTTANNV